MTMVLTPGEFADWTARLRDRLAPAVQRGLLSGGMRALTVVDRHVRAAPPANPQRIGIGGAVNYGHYAGAWKSVRIPHGVRVFNSMPYSGIIEWGRNPGTMPPRAAIALWAQRRLGLPPKQAHRAAFAIARAIRTRGLLPRKVLEDAVPELTDTIHTEIVRELDAELAR